MASKTRQIRPTVSQLFQAERTLREAATMYAGLHPSTKAADDARINLRNAATAYTLIVDRIEAA